MCGVIGVSYSEGVDAFPDVVNGLFQMQHRGQDATGISISDGSRSGRTRRSAMCARFSPTVHHGISGATWYVGTFAIPLRAPIGW